MNVNLVSKAITRLMEVESARKVTLFVSDKEVIHVSRKQYKGKFSKRAVELVITVGRPNYEDRVFIKSLKKSKAGTSSIHGSIKFKHVSKKKGKK